MSTDPKKNYSIEQLANDIHRHPLVNLQQGPLMAFQLIKISQKEHLLIIQAHHFVFDGMTLLLILNKISCNYGKKTCYGNDNDLYKINSEKYLAFQDYYSTLGAKSSWRWYGKEIAAAMSNTECPFTKTTSSTEFLSEIKRNIELEKTKAIKRALKKQGSTINICFALIFSIVCHKISGKNKFIVEIPVNIRKYVKTNFHGNYQYPLPLIIDICSFQSFSENLFHLTNKIKTIKKNYESLDSIYENDNIKKYYLSNDYRVLVNQSMRDINVLSLDNISSELVFIKSSGGLFDIQLDYEETKSGLEVFLIYKKDKFLSNQMEFLLNQVIHLASVFSENYSLLISEYQFTSSNLKFFKTSFDEDFLHSKLKQNFYPNNKRLAYQDDENEYSYGYFYSLIEANLAIFQEKNEAPPSLVLIYLENNLSLIVMVITLVILRIPIVMIDVKEPITRLLYYIEDSGADFLLSDQPLVGLSSSGWKTNYNEDKTVLIYKKPASYHKSNYLKKNLAYIAYTSGSTGKPKGIQVNYHNLNNVLFYFYKEIEFSHEEKFLLISSPGFDIFFLELLLPFIFGGTILNALPLRDKLMKLGAFIDKFKPDFIQTTPSYWQLLIDKIKSHRNFTIFTGGEWLNDVLKKRLLSLSPKVYNVYGPTETTIWSACTRVKMDVEAEITQPIFNTQLFVLNNNNELVPPGFCGELFISGAGVSDGYVHDSLNHDRFLSLSLPINNSCQVIRVFKTGDIVYRDIHNKIYYRNRNDNVIKLNGIRIDLNEIRSILLSLNAPLDAHVIFHPKEKYLVAFIILKEAYKNVEEKSISQELRNLLPAYLIPSKIIFVNKFPMTKSGKIDAQALLCLLQKKKTSSENKFCSIAQLVAETLGTNNINRSSSFFEQGGTSLRAIDLAAKILDQFFINVDLADILQANTIEAIILLVKSKIELSSPEDSINSISPRDRFEITILSCLEQQSPLYKNLCITRPVIKSRRSLMQALSLGEKYLYGRSFDIQTKKLDTIASISERFRKHSSEHSLNPLVPFRISPSSSEYIIFIHAIGGNIWRYVELAGLIKGNVNIFGLECIGLSSSISPLNTMDKIILTYSHSIRELKPEKLILVGWCMGALIADKLSLALEDYCLDISVVYINISPYPLLNARKDILPNYTNVFEIMKKAFIENIYDHNQVGLFSEKDLVNLTAMGLIFKKIYDKRYSKKSSFSFYYENSYFFRMLKVQYANLKILVLEKNVTFNRLISKHVFLTKDCFQNLNISDDEMIDFLNKNDAIKSITQLSGNHFTAVHGESAKRIADFLNHELLTVC